jgi:hypothetical protein
MALDVALERENPNASSFKASTGNVGVLTSGVKRTDP